jgi:hypothetical protein
MKIRIPGDLMKRALWVGLLVVFVILSYSIVSFVHEDLTKREPGKVFKADRSDEGTVTARAWVEPSEYEPGAQARCWVRLENRTKDPVTHVRFAVAQALSSFLKTDAVDFTDRINRDLNARLAPPGSLPADGVVSFWTRLPFPDKAGQYDFDLIYRWDGAAENRLLIGPLDVPGPMKRLMQTGSSLYGVAKDMAVPLAVVFLTWAFSHYDEKRKQAEAAKEKIQLAAEEKKEQARKEAERQTQQVRETWARMLIISRRDTSTYYLPLLAAVTRIVRTAEERTPQWDRECFFYLMKFLRVMRRIGQENGGIYLKSRKGEDVVAGVWSSVIQPAIEKKFTLKTCAAAIDQFDSRESYAQFDDTFEKKPATAACWKAFQDWQVDKAIPFTAYVPLLKLFKSFLQYEKDRPLDYWYGSAQKPPREEIEGLLRQVLRRSPLAQQITANHIDTDVKTYLAEAQREYREFNQKLGIPDSGEDKPELVQPGQEGSGRGNLGTR